MSRIIQDFDPEDLDGTLDEAIVYLKSLRAEGWVKLAMPGRYDDEWYGELSRPHTAEEMAKLEAEKRALIDAQAAHEEKKERAEWVRLNAKYAWPHARGGE